MVQEVEVITQRFPFATPQFLAIFLCCSLLLAAPLHQCGSSMGYSPSEVSLLQHAGMTQGSSRSYPIDKTLHPLLLKPCILCPQAFFNYLITWCNLITSLFWEENKKKQNLGLYCIQEYWLFENIIKQTSQIRAICWFDLKSFYIICFSA